MRTEVAMGTLVTIRVVRPCEEAAAAIGRAFGWFHEIEDRTTRFSPNSELMQLTARAGAPVAVSTILFEAVRIALMVAEVSGGAFDPTVGRRMEARGFNRNYRTGQRTGRRARRQTNEKVERSGRARRVPCARFSPEIVRSRSAAGDDAGYRDVALDPERRTIALRRPLTLDLGAVAKGLAVDAAARELEPFRDFAIDAGGDLYLGGCNERGSPWHVGIRHPRDESEPIALLCVSNQAVCTSGDYERRADKAHATEHHILDPRTGASPRSVTSATVVASQAVLADALATAVFVLGPRDGIDLLDSLGLDGLIVTPELKQHQTRGLPRAA